MDFQFVTIPDGTVYTRTWNTLRVEEKRLVEQTYHLMSTRTAQIVEAVKEASIGPALYKLKYDEDSVILVRLSDGKIMDSYINSIPFTERTYNKAYGDGEVYALVLDRLVLSGNKKEKDHKPHPALVAEKSEQFHD